MANKAPEPLQKNGKRKFQFRKKHIKWIVLLAVVMIIAVLIATCSNRVQQAIASMNSIADTTVLEYGALQNTIGATGRVESSEKTNVYSTMTYTVSAVHAKVGDRVQAGDTLLELDRASIEKQIQEKELSMESSAASSAQSIKSARDTYQNFKDGLSKNTNASLISALSSVDSALDNWEKAQKTYDEYARGLNLGENSAILAQQTAFNNASEARNRAEADKTAANKALGAAKKAVADYDTSGIDVATELAKAEDDRDIAKAAARNAEIDYNALLASYPATPTDTERLALIASEKALQIAQNEYAAAEQQYQLWQSILSSGGASNAELEALKADIPRKQAAYDAADKAYSTAQTAYDNALSSYTAALRGADSTLADYAKAVSTAQRNYETALASLTAAETSADNQLESYKNSLDSARIASSQDLAEYQLEKMQEDLLKASVTAPVAGTVTASYAIEGATGNGLLFVIEDTEQLIVKTTIKEYDIQTVKEGMRVTIRSDATGEEEYEGVITRIAPTASKNAQGNTDTSSDVQFETEVRVTSPGTPLRIGMSVRLNYILEDAENVLKVPYDAVYQNAEGQDVVLAALEQPDGKYLLKEIAVTQGIENDLDVVISGEGIEPGLRIMNNPERYVPGQEIILQEQSLSDLAGAGMNMPFMMGRG